MKVYTINAPHFNAGIMVDDKFTVVQAAPIIRYMIGWDLGDVMEYCEKRKWDFQGS
jgi:hypothetical protein